MMEWPCFSSSFAREKTARAPSPFSCETREAILRFGMGSSLPPRGKGWSARKRGVLDCRTPLKVVTDELLERVAQRELDKPRRSEGAGDFAEWAVRQADALNICGGWIAEVRMVPHIEEIGCKTQRLPLSQFEVLEQRKVPVLLARAAISVTAEITETRSAEIGVRRDRGVRLVGIAQRRIEQRCGTESVRIQVAINSLADAAVAQAARNGSTAGQACGLHARGGPKSKEGTSGAGIKHGERRARLKQRNSANGPAGQQSALPTRFVLKPGQVVAIADREPVSPVKVGQATRSVESGFVVEGTVEGCVASRSRIGRARESISRLEITSRPAARHGGLQRVVMRIGVIGEELKAVVAVDSLRAGTGNRVGKCVGGDVLTAQHDGICRCGVL